MISQPSTNVSYRPEIDGLRAVAILSVILYHLGVSNEGTNLVPGGFIGVDIFFVISGYLITSILIDGISERNFSILNFYERRARRILPILLLVMTVSLPAAWTLLLPSEFIDFSYQLGTGIFFSSNFYYWLDEPYWTTDFALKPFLHTWTLAVEEQFYFLMPIFLLLITKARNDRLTSGILVGLFLSVGYAQWASAFYPQQSFYLLPSRAWELLAGAFLASVPPFAKTKFGIATKHLPSVGFLLLIFSILWFDEKTFHPSLYTLAPIVGTMLILYFANEHDSTIRVLKSKVFVGVGLISYSLYVWHLPVFAFADVAGRLGNVGAKAAWLLGVFAVSTVSFYWVEKPVRSFEQVPSRMFWPIIAVWVSALGCFAFVGTMDGYAHRVPQFANQPARPEKIENYQWFRTPIDRIGNVLLVGDSHANAIAPILGSWALDNGFDFAKSGSPGCLLLIDAARVNRSDFSPKKNCTTDTQSHRMKFLLDSEPAIVILVSRLQLLLEEDRFDNEEGKYEGKMQDFIQDSANSLMTKEARQLFIRDKLLKTVNLIVNAGHQVVLVYPIPEVGWHVPKALLKKVDGNYLKAREIVSVNPVTTSYEVFQRRTMVAYDVLNQVPDENVHRIYPERVFCNNKAPGRCATHNQDVSYYRDDVHLSADGAELMVEDIKKVLRTYAR